MIQTQNEKERGDKIREKLEDITREIVILRDVLDELDERVFNKTFKKKCRELQSLESERNRLINLLNTMP